MILSKKIDPALLGVYCIVCSSKIETVEQKTKNNKKYHCTVCGNQADRAIIIDDQVLVNIDAVTREISHKSVGALIFNENNQILLFNLTKFPYGYTIPAGHLDINEEPENAVIREIEEETGIKDVVPKKVLEFWIDNDSCRRGADKHYWYVYKASINTAKNKITIDKNEGINPVWLSLDNISSIKMAFAADIVLEQYIKLTD